MAIYLGRNVVLAFCVDYSASRDGRLVVYEGQHLLSDNFDSPDTRADELGRRSALGAQITVRALNRRRQPSALSEARRTLHEKKYCNLELEKAIRG